MTNCPQSSFEHLPLIQRWLLLLLLGGMLILLLEIRFEHQAVLGETWQSWIPLGYLGLMCGILPLGLLTIDRFGYKLLAVAFIGLMAVGSLGFWFHAKGKVGQRFGTIVKTVASQPGQLLETEDQDTTAPLLAPLSLVGLGAMGFLISIMRSGDKWNVASRTGQSDKDNLQPCTEDNFLG